jgi:hypothetical protein
MLKMEVSDNGYVLVITCDWCEKRITAATEGNYEYEVDAQGRPLNETSVFAHTQCCRAFEEAHGGAGRWQMDDLQCFPLQLGHSLLVDWTEAERLCGTRPRHP